MKNYISTMKLKQIIFIVSLVSSCLGYAQTNIDFKQFHVGGETTVRSGMALSPDGNFVAIAGMQSYPLFIYDWKNDAVVKKFDVGDWYAGAKVSYSAKGTYIMLHQTFYNDFKVNKDREVDFEIISAENGELIKKFNTVHSVQIAASEKFCVVLTGNEVAFYELPSGKKLKSFTVKDATNSVALSVDETYIAVSHRPTEEQVKNSPTIRNDKKAKKAIKPALKYREMISIYDATTFEKIKTVNELYDIIYTLKFSTDGKRLYSYSIPHTKMQTSTAGRQGYIYTISVPDWEPQRVSFVSLSNYEPDFMENSDHSLFGIVSMEGAFAQVNIYNAKTGRLVDRFNTVQRLRDGLNKKMMGDGRASFVFLPDESILLVTGNSTYLWRPNLD